MVDPLGRLVSVHTMSRNCCGTNAPEMSLDVTRAVWMTGHSLHVLLVLACLCGNCRRRAAPVRRCALHKCFAEDFNVVVEVPEP